MAKTVLKKFPHSVKIDGKSDFISEREKYTFKDGTVYQIWFSQNKNGYVIYDEKTGKFEAIEDVRVLAYFDKINRDAMIEKASTSPDDPRWKTRASLLKELFEISDFATLSEYTAIRRSLMREITNEEVKELGDIASIKPIKSKVDAKRQVAEMGMR